MDGDLYDQLWRVEQTHWWFQARRHIVYTLVDRYLDSGKRLRICDIGCGTGGNLLPLADRHDVVGVESSSQGVEFARRRLGDRVQLGQLPHELGLPDESFDLVLLLDVMEHVEDDASSAAAVLRLLRPGGIVIATVPANPWLYSQYDVRLHHFRRYRKEQFRQLWLSAGAKLELLSYYNSLLFLPAASVRVASKLLPSRDATVDLEVPPWPLNAVLAPIMKCEARMVGQVPLPWGLSLVSVVRRK